MIVVDNYSIDQLFGYIEDKQRTLPNGHRFRYTSPRIQMFFQKGITCVSCGLSGNVFRLETHKETITPHINLYHYDKETNESTLFTKDHIYPKSKGGKDELDNFQTMCTHCNRVKTDNLPLFCEYVKLLAEHNVSKFPEYAVEFRK